VVQEESNKNLFYNFWTLIQVSTNFGSLGQFLEFKQLKNATQCRASNRPTACGARVKTAHGRRPATRGRRSWPSRGGGCDTWKRSAHRAHSWRGHRAQLTRAGAVTRSTAARWGLAGAKVLPASTGGVPGWRRAGRVEAGLTLAAAQREGAERRCLCRGGGRRRGREGSGERRGGPAARGGGEGGGCGMTSDW
jgi:hypothetical protein